MPAGRDRLSKAMGLEKVEPSPGLSFHVRPVNIQDANGLADLFRREWEHSLGATIDEPSSLAQIKSMISNVSRFTGPELLFLVADSGETHPAATGIGLRERLGIPTGSGSRDLLGWVALTPYEKSARSCFDRTATMSLTSLEGSPLSLEHRRAVVTALIRAIFAACQERGARYKTVVITTAFREDQPQLQEHVYVLQEEGFRVVGMLENVIEKDGLLLNRMILQRDV